MESSDGGDLLISREGADDQVTIYDGTQNIRGDQLEDDVDDGELLSRHNCSDRVIIIAIPRLEDIPESELFVEADSDNVTDNNVFDVNWHGGRRSSSRIGRTKAVYHESTGGEDDEEFLPTQEEDEESDNPYRPPSPARKRTKKVNTPSKKDAATSDVTVTAKRTRRRTGKMNYTTPKIPVTEGEKTCIGCGQVQESLKALRLHAPSCSIKRPFVCSICGLDFGGYQSFLVHKRSRHLGFLRKRQPKSTVKIDWCPTDIMCDRCGRKWTTVDELKRHLLAHNRASESKCSVCHLVLKSPGGLRHHFQVVHLGIQENGVSLTRLRMEIDKGLRGPHATPTADAVPPFKEIAYVTCDICGENFWWQWKLDEHKFRKHSKELGKPKPFSCVECGINFKDNTSYGIHRRGKKHSKEKHLMCDYCGKGFRRGEDLRKHIKRVHPENFEDIPQKFLYGDTFQWQRQFPQLDLAIFEDDFPDPDDEQLISGDVHPETPEPRTEQSECPPSQPEHSPEQPECPIEIPTDSKVTVTEGFHPLGSATVDEGDTPMDTYDDYAPPEEPPDYEWEMKYPPPTPMTLSLKRARDDSVRDSKQRLSSKRSRMMATMKSSFQDHDDSPSLNVKIEEDVACTLPESPEPAAANKRKKKRKTPSKIKCRLGGCRYWASDREELAAHRLQEHDRMESPQMLPTAPKKKKVRKAPTGIKCRLGGCRFWASNREELATHRLEMHGRNDGVRSYVFKCDHPGCSFRARYQESLDAHLPSHSPTTAAKGTSALGTPDNFVKDTPAKMGEKTQKLGRPPILGRRSKPSLPIYICTFPDCDKKFYHRIRLNAHISNYHQNPTDGSARKTLGDESLGTAAVSRGGDRYKSPARCRFLNCKFRAVLRSELRKHRLETHGSAFGKSFRAKRPLAVWTHCGLGGCKFRCILPETLETHQRTQHEHLPPASNFKCPECPKIFSTNAYRQTHIKIKHKQETNVIPRRSCKFCTKDFCNRVNLHLHIRKDHADAPIFACSFCTKIYYDQDYATIHESRHSFQKTTPYKCVYENCGEVCKSLEELRSHVSAIHDAPLDARLVCPTCGKQVLLTAYSVHKGTHARRNKKKEKVHECGHCERKFFKKCEVEVHTESVHPKVFAGTGKGYTCDICGASFFTSGAFNRHRYTAHPKRNPSLKPRAGGGNRKPRKPKAPGDLPIKKRKPRRREESLPTATEASQYHQSRSVTSESCDGSTANDVLVWMPANSLENRWGPREASYSLQQFLQRHQSHPQQPHHPLFNYQHPYAGFRN